MAGASILLRTIGYEDENDYCWLHKGTIYAGSRWSSGQGVMCAAYGDAWGHMKLLLLLLLLLMLLLVLLLLLLLQMRHEFMSSQWQIHHASLVNVRLELVADC